MDQEHDCLPLMEHTGNGETLANAIQRITEAFQKLFPVTLSVTVEAFEDATVEAFEELGRLALSPRGYRKAVRWDEKNRRRRLKGLPEKPYPYPDRLLQIASSKLQK